MDSLGKIIYEHRVAGGMWSTAPVGPGVSFIEGMQAAKEYALENDLPWPPLRRVQGRPPTEVEESTVKRMQRAAAALFIRRSQKKPE